MSPLLPGITEFRARDAFLAAGLTKAEDRRAKYYVLVSDRDDAERLLAGFRGATDRARTMAAVEFLAARAAESGPVKVPLPMRRLIAIK